MSKKTHWTNFATFELGDFHDSETDNTYTPTKEQYKNYRKKMFKWGMKVDKMSPEKISFNKKKKDSKETEE